MAKKTSEQKISHEQQGRLILVSGNDELAVKNKAKSLVIEFCGEDYERNPSVEIIAGDSDKQKLPTIISDFIVAVKTPPFLCATHFIWLKNFPFETALKTEKPKDMEEAIENLKQLLLEPIPDYLQMLISGPGIDRRSSFFKTLDKVAKIYFIEKIDASAKDWQNELQGLIYDYCNEKGVKISNDATVYLCETIGANSGRIKSELDKAIAFVYPANEITLDDCRKIASRTAEANAWAFSNSIMARDLQGALSAIAESCDTSKNSERTMFYSLLSCIKLLPSIKSAAKTLGLSAKSTYPTVKNAIEKEKDRLGENPVAKMNPYRFYMLLKDSERFSDAEIPQIMSDVLKANRGLVSGSVFSDRELLEQITLKICSSGQKI